MSHANALSPVVSADDIPAVQGLRSLHGYVSEADERPRRGGRRRAVEYRVEAAAAALRRGVRRLGDSAPIPEWGRRLADRMLADGVTDRPFDQMLVNEYTPGQGISPHRDYSPFGRTVVSLSLLSPCVMNFRHVATGRKERLLLSRRSLLVLSDEAWFDWEHGIAPRKRGEW